jgi:DNA-binding FadR family transcriptional regulator
MKKLIRSKIALRRPAGLAVQLADALRKLIENEDLKPGDKLPSELDLMETYNVSRTVVREAISSLKAENLVSTHQGIGAFVLQTVPIVTYRIPRKDLNLAKEIIDLIELRVSLESETAALAALRRTPEHLEAMSKALADMKEFVGSPRENAEPDFDFHLAIANASNNHYFSYLFRHFGPQLIPRASIKGYGDMGSERSDYLQRINREHNDIYHAIVRQDAEAARTAMRNHLINALERLRSAYGEQIKTGNKS